MNAQASLIRPMEPASEDSGQEEVFVTLSVAGQLCGIPVLSVRDILGPQTITKIPLAPAEVAGSLNLRGRIVTAIDLRRRLNLPKSAEEGTSMYVVAEQGSELYALLVDHVSEVMSLPSRQFEANPPTLPPEWARFSSGIYRLQGKLLAVLDVSRLLALSSDTK